VSVIAGIGLGPFDSDWIASALILTTPILLASVGEVVSERAGVLNVGLEGMMLAGAFFSYWAVFLTGDLLLGILAGIAAGIFFGIVMSLLTIVAGADQIVSGIGINLAAFGLTAFLFDEVFGEREQVVISTIGDLKIPGLADLGGIGEAIFNQDPVLYFAFLLVPALWFFLYKTKWGLSVRGSGEMPAAVDTAGISIKRVRWGGVLAAAGLAGLAGAFLVLVEVGIFRQGMTAGRGFLALVAVIFGRWTPVGTLGACLILGGTDALQLRLAGQEEVPREVWGVLALLSAGFIAYWVLFRRGVRARRLALGVVIGIGVSGVVLFAITPAVELPDQVWRALPFLLALAVLAGAVTKARMPTKLTLPYNRGEG
jgi:simple sugar transport system permease protein